MFLICINILSSALLVHRLYTDRVYAVSCFFFIYTLSANFESAFFLHKPYKSYCRIVALQAGYETMWQLCNIPAARKIKFFQIGPLTIIEVCPFVWNKMLNYRSSSSLFNFFDWWKWVRKKNSCHAIIKRNREKLWKLLAKKMYCKPTLFACEKFTRG